MSSASPTADETPEEQFDALVPFFRFGLERGERCLYVADQTTAVSTADLQHRLEFINRAERRMLGIPEGEDVPGTRLP